MLWTSFYFSNLNTYIKFDSPCLVICLAVPFRDGIYHATYKQMNVIYVWWWCSSPPFTCCSQSPKSIFFDLTEARRVAQLSVIVSFLMFCLHSCESSSWVEDGFHGHRAVVTHLILKVILAQLLMSLHFLIY